MPRAQAATAPPPIYQPPPLSQAIYDLTDQYLPGITESVRLVSQSSALLAISFATVRNIPYVHSKVAKEMDINPFTNFISSRICYLEASMMVLSSTICNLFFAIFYTGASFATLGVSETFNFAARMRWLNVVCGSICTGIGTVGVLNPKAGIGLNILLLLRIKVLMKGRYDDDVDLFERPLIDEIQRIWRDYSELISYFGRSEYDEKKYQQVVSPSIAYIESVVLSSKRIDEFLQLAAKVKKEWPEVNDKLKEQDRGCSEPRAVHHIYEVDKVET